MASWQIHRSMSSIKKGISPHRRRGLNHRDTENTEKEQIRETLETSRWTRHHHLWFPRSAWEPVFPRSAGWANTPGMTSIVSRVKRPSCSGQDAERRRRHSHAERGNEGDGTHRHKMLSRRARKTETVLTSLSLPWFSLCVLCVSVVQSSSSSGPPPRRGSQRAFIPQSPSPAPVWGGCRQTRRRRFAPTVRSRVSPS